MRGFKATKYTRLGSSYSLYTPGRVFSILKTFYLFIFTSVNGQIDKFNNPNCNIMNGDAVSRFTFCPKHLTTIMLVSSRACTSHHTPISIFSLS